MFIEPRDTPTLKAPEERNVWAMRAYCAPLELKNFYGNMIYKHLAALRPGHDLLIEF